MTISKMLMFILNHRFKNILDTEIKDIDSRINSQFEQISKDLKEIKDIINQIESSKIGKKIFK